MDVYKKGRGDGWTTFPSDGFSSNQTSLGLVLPWRVWLSLQQDRAPRFRAVATSQNQNTLEKDGLDIQKLSLSLSRIGA